MTKLNELLNMKLSEVLEKYVQIHNLECGYLYGIAELDDADQLYSEYNIKEGYPQAFMPEELIHQELDIYSEDAEVMTYEKMENIMKNLGITKKSMGVEKDDTSIQRTLFEDSEIIEYWGLNAWGKPIKIPNFQPLPYDDNPRLDVENEKTKRKNKKGK